MFAGYGIARTINRIHYLPFEEPRALVENYLDYLGRVFPRLNKTYVLANERTKQTVLKFAEGPLSYADPSGLRNLTDQFLLLDFVGAQNPRYFEDYAIDVRAILQFSKDKERYGSMTTRFLRSHSDSMCVHVRMTDFVQLEWQTDMNITVNAAIELAKRKNISHFLIFGDDQPFMIDMSKVIIRDGGFESDAVIVSNYNETMDLYLSSQMCRSFLISAAISTFGWWLAFLAKDQSAVYYLNVTRPNVFYRKREFFMKTWRLYPDDL